MKCLWVVLALAVSGIAFEGAEDFDTDMGAYDDPYEGYGGGYDDPYGYGGYGGAEQSAVKQFSSSDELKSFMKEHSDQAIIVGYFDDSAEADIQTFQDVASSENYSKYAMTTSKDILEELNYSGSVVFIHPPSKYLQSPLERSKYRYPSKKLSKDSLITFIRSKSLPLVGELSFSTENLYSKQTMPVLILFIDLDFKMEDKSFAFYFKRLVKVRVHLSLR